MSLHHLSYPNKEVNGGAPPWFRCLCYPVREADGSARTGREVDGKTKCRAASRGTAEASASLSRRQMAACPSVASTAPCMSLIQGM